MRAVVGARDRVALLSENRPEWVMADRAVLCLGAVTVPLYPNLPVAQVGEILRDSSPRLACASTVAQAARVHEAAPGLTTIVLDDLDAALARVAGPPRDWQAHAHAVAPDDLATLYRVSPRSPPEYAMRVPSGDHTAGE